MKSAKSAKGKRDIMEEYLKQFGWSAEKNAIRELRAGSWTIYDKYFCDYVYDRGGPVGDKHLFAPRHYRSEGGGVGENKKEREYAPLHVPGLFLEFARLVEEEE